MMKLFLTKLVLPIVKVFTDNKYTEISTTIRVPFKDNGAIIEQISWERVLKAHSATMQKALILRMQSCTFMVQRAKEILKSNEFSIIFKKNNGQIHSFNHASYQAMDEAIKLLSDDEFSKLEIRHIEQIQKALYWIEKPEDEDNISFGNLISCLDELRSAALYNHKQFVDPSKF